MIVAWRWKTGLACLVHPYRRCLLERTAMVEQTELELDQILQDEVREGREASEDGDLPF